MAPKSYAPEHALVVVRYDEFRQLVGAFAQGRHQLMTIVGKGGIGKSEIVKRTMQETHGGAGWLLLKGKHTPLDLYRRLYLGRTRPVVLDDLDGLLRDANNTSILKCVCDTTPVKRVEWGSSHAAFSQREDRIPSGFESISRVCIVANDLETVNANIQAVQDRGVLILFRPDALEVHREVARGGWFDDFEVFDFIGRNLFLVSRPSMRLYLTAKNHKLAGLNWKSLTLRTLGTDADPRLLLVARLLSDSSFEGQAARERAFKQEGGGSRATYHRYKKELLARRGEFDAEASAAIQLGPTIPDLHYLALCDRRKQLEEMGRDDNEEDADDANSSDTDRQTPDKAEDFAPTDRLTKLRREMENAIATEDYEGAAKLRDEINRLQTEDGRDE